MVIQHNMRAINARRQYGMAIGNAASDAEKLSSGYRINKSADDAAGLSISEKMRRQIRGLTRGVHNTEEGISLCQVADGALNEVHDIVHRLNSLSVQAANGTNERSDRELIQDEVDQLLTEINRISDTTTFNGQNLFGGAGVGEIAEFDSSKAIMSAAEAVAKFIREEGMADAYMTTEGADRDIIKSLTAAKAPAPIADADIAPLAARDAAGTFEVTGTGLAEGYDYIYDEKTGILQINTTKAMTIKAVGGTASLDKIKFRTDTLAAKITLQGDFRLEGDFTIPGSMFSGAKLTMNKDSKLTVASGAKLTIGESACLVMDGFRNASPLENGVTVEKGAVIMISDSAELTLYKSYLYIKGTGKVTDGGSSGKIVGASGEIYAPSTSNITVRTQAGSMKGDYTGKGAELFPEPDPPKAQETQSPKASAQNISAYASGKRRLMKKWWIQSGNDAYDGMYVDIDAMNIKTLGLLGLNVTTQKNADKAINTIDGALSYVSAMRSRIGAQQNRLEHIVLNENNIVENTTAAESRIRDADMAQGMAAFSISNIFVRAGETMLAQANTSNDGVMALLG